MITNTGLKSNLNSFADILIPAEFLGLVDGKAGTDAAFRDFIPTLGKLSKTT